MFSRTLARPLCQACVSRAQQSGRMLLVERVRQSSPTTHTPRRHMATPPPMVRTSDLPLDRYHALSDATMDTLLESLETLVDDLSNPKYEVEYHSGVLTLTLGEHGTYVINKQPPNKQIWLSSPFSGPKRYDYSPTADDWYYSRDGTSMGELLEEELSKALQQKVELGLKGLSEKLQ